MDNKIMDAARICVESESCSGCPLYNDDGFESSCRRAFARAIVDEAKKNDGVVEEEAVNHPEHYQGDVECIEIMRAMFGDGAVSDFCRCNSFKYRFRAGNKKGSSYEQDIAKAVWYENYLMKINGFRVPIGLR